MSTYDPEYNESLSSDTWVCERRQAKAKSSSSEVTVAVVENSSEGVLTNWGWCHWTSTSCVSNCIRWWVRERSNFGFFKSMNDFEYFLPFYLFVPSPKLWSWVDLLCAELLPIHVGRLHVFPSSQNGEWRLSIVRHRNFHLEMAVLSYHKVEPAK